MNMLKWPVRARLDMLRAVDLVRLGWIRLDVIELGPLVRSCQMVV